MENILKGLVFLLFFSTVWGCTFEKEDQYYFKSINVLRDDINEASILDSFIDSNTYVLIDSIYKDVTSDDSFYLERKTFFKNVTMNEELSFSHFTMNAGLIDTFIVNNRKYIVKQINIYSGGYAIVVYFNESLDELILVKENSESILSTIFLRKDYLKNKIISKLINKILFSKRFILYKLYNPTC